MEYSDLVYLCAMNRIFNYHCRLAREVAEKYTAPETLFSLSADALKEIFGKDSPYPERFADHAILDDAEKEVEWAGMKGVRVICYRDPGYPRRLKQCEDAPLLLFLAGNADLNAGRIVSVVGTRKVTPYGESACHRILESLASLDEKPLIVSGLAYGVDICAHRAAMALGMETVGVMATGIDEIYPRVHRSDAAAMCSRGGVLTEFWRGAPPNKYNFLRRNRIIAGLCDAVVLIESDIDGGGVVTSKMAFSYSREVFAVPGRISDRWSSGCNSLIGQKIAETVTSPDRVGRCLGWKKRHPDAGEGGRPALFPSDSSVKRNIVVALSHGSEMDLNGVVDAVNADCQTIISVLTELELDGRIVCDERGKYRIL